MPKPPLRSWFYAWAAAVLAAMLVAGLAVGVYVVSQPQILGFGTPTPFAEKPVSLMLRQFTGGFLWGGATAILFAITGATIFVCAVALWWTSSATAPQWLWILIGSVFGYVLVIPIFGAAPGFLVELIAAIAGAFAALAARRQILRKLKE